MTYRPTLHISDTISYVIAPNLFNFCF